MNHEYNLSDSICVKKISPGFFNSFLIKVKDTFLLVDTCRWYRYKALMANIDNQLEGNSKLKYLILTHTHFDHSENARRLKRDYGLEIIVHEQEAYFLREGYSPLPHGTNVFTEWLTFVGREYLSGMFKHQSVNADIEIDQITNMAEYGLPEIQLIPLPGHSKGSMGIIINDEIALVGDTLIHVRPNSVFPPFADDLIALMKSWDLLLQTKCNIFIPGHGYAITRALLEKNYNKIKN